MIPDYNGITAMVGDRVESVAFPARHCKLVAAGDTVVLMPIDWVPTYRSDDWLIRIKRKVWERATFWRVAR